MPGECDHVPDNDTRPRCELVVCCCCLVLAVAFFGVILHFSGAMESDLFQKPHIIWRDDEGTILGPNNNGGPHRKPNIPLITRQGTVRVHGGRPNDQPNGGQGRALNLQQDSGHSQTPRAFPPVKLDGRLPDNFEKRDGPDESDEFRGRFTNEPRFQNKARERVPNDPRARIGHGPSLSTLQTKHVTDPAVVNTTNKFGVVHLAEYYPPRKYEGIPEPKKAQTVIFCHVRHHAPSGIAHPMAKPCTHFLVALQTAMATQHADLVVPPRVSKAPRVVLTREKLLMSPNYRDELKRHVEKFNRIGYSGSGVFLLDPMADVGGRINAVGDVSRQLNHDVVFLLSPTTPTVFTQPFIQEALFYSGKYVVLLNNRLNHHIGRRFICDNPFDFVRQGDQPPIKSIRKAINDTRDIIWRNNSYIVPTVSLRLNCYDLRRSLDAPPPEMHPSQRIDKCANTGCPDFFSDANEHKLLNGPYVSPTSDCTIFWRRDGIVLSGIAPGNVKTIQAIQQSFQSIALWHWDDWCRCFKS